MVPNRPTLEISTPQSPSGDENEASSPEQETPEEGRPPCIRLHSTLHKIIDINGVGHICSDSFLTNTLFKLSKHQSSVALEIAMATIPLVYTPLNLANNNLSTTALSIADAAKAIEFLQHHQINPPGLKRYGNISGIATLLWRGGKTITPYVNSHGQMLIPMESLEKMQLKDSLNVPPTYLSGWLKAHLLLEMHKSYFSTSPSKHPQIREIPTASVDTIQQITGTIIHIKEYNPSIRYERTQEIC